MKAASVAGILMVASFALVALLNVTHEDATTIHMSVDEVISEASFLQGESKQHKVFASLVELRAYCLEARGHAQDILITSTHADSGLLGFIIAFGKPEPTKDQYEAMTKAQRTYIDENPFNVAKAFNKALETVQAKLTKGKKIGGLPDYLIKHLKAAVATGQTVLTIDKDKDGAEVSRFSGKAVGLQETPKYFNTLAVSYAKVQKQEIKTITKAKAAVEVQKRRTVKQKIEKMVNADLDPVQTDSDEKAQEAASEAIKAEEDKSKKARDASMARAKAAQAAKQETSKKIVNPVVAKAVAEQKAKEVAQEKAFVKAAGTVCAQEGGTCDCVGVVRYGPTDQRTPILPSADAYEKFAKKESTGQIACNNGVFGGDPTPGIKKSCSCIPAATPYQVQQADAYLVSTESQ